MQLAITFFRAYPWQTMFVLLALLLAGLVEGFSLSALLPLLTIATETTALAPGGSSDEPELARIVTTTLLSIGIKPTLGVLIAIIVAGVAVKSGLVLLAKKQVGYTVAQVATDLRLALLHALLNTRWEYYLNLRVGGLANSISSEAMRASMAYFHCATVVALVIQTTAYIGVAALISWQTTAVVLATGILLLSVLRRLVRKARRAGKRQTKVLKSLSARLADCLQSVKPLKAMAREELADAMLTVETGRLNKALRKEVLSSETLTAVQEPMFAAIAGVIIIVAIDFLGLPLAMVLALTVLLGRGLAGMGRVQRSYQKMAVHESAYYSIQKTIDSAELQREVWRGTHRPDLQSAIRLEGVRFSYGDRDVLADLSLTIPANRFTALTGPSGVGKTTVVDLITGLLKSTEGTIYVDDQPLEQLDLRGWRRMIGYVPQENLLLHDSIWRNVTLGDSDLSEADAERALRSAEAWEFVQSLPKGLHTVVGERGAKLSGGQRQRIMMARALVHRPRLLIMDEPTSALDPRSEAAICATMHGLRGQLTILAISHQKALIDIADRVYLLQDRSATLVTAETPRAVAAQGT